jgi:Ca-activated chloride channel family protein
MTLAFDTPWILLLLPLCLAVPWVVLRRRERRSADLLRALGPRAVRLRGGEALPVAHRRQACLTVGVLVMLVCAASAPRFGGPGASAQAGPLDLVVCIDVSRSMRARDARPDRAGAARRAIRALVERAQGDRVGLVAFAGSARRIVPRTTDCASLLELLDAADELSVPRGGTDLAAALQAGATALAGRSPDSPGVLLLVTDGEDPDRRGLAAARKCREQGIRVFVAGCGSSRGSKIPVAVAGGEVWLQDNAGQDVVSAPDEAALEAIAQAGGGAYVGCDEAALTDLYATRLAMLAPVDVAASEGVEESGNRYRLPLLVALLLLSWSISVARSRR